MDSDRANAGRYARAEVSARTAHRVRWIALWSAVVVWFVAFALDLGGSAIHFLLLGALALLVYQLLVAETP
jgi:hypothetical protein